MQDLIFLQIKGFIFVGEVGLSVYICELIWIFFLPGICHKQKHPARWWEGPQISFCLGLVSSTHCEGSYALPQPLVHWEECTVCAQWGCEILQAIKGKNGPVSQSSYASGASVELLQRWYLIAVGTGSIFSALGQCPCAAQQCPAGENQRTETGAAHLVPTHWSMQEIQNESIPSTGLPSRRLKISSKRDPIYVTGSRSFSQCSTQILSWNKSIRSYLALWGRWEQTSLCPLVGSSGNQVVILSFISYYIVHENSASTFQVKQFSSRWFPTLNMVSGFDLNYQGKQCMLGCLQSPRDDDESPHDSEIVDEGIWGLPTYWQCLLGEYS